MKVLIVDEAISYVSEIKSLLDAQGYHTTIASQEDCIPSKIIELDPDLIIVDVDSGNRCTDFSTVEYLQKSGLTIPYVVLYNVSSKGIRSKAYDLGCLDCLSKKTEKEVFIKKIIGYTAIGCLEKKLNKLLNKH